MTKRALFAAIDSNRRILSIFSRRKAAKGILFVYFDRSGNRDLPTKRWVFSRMSPVFVELFRAIESNDDLFAPCLTRRSIRSGANRGPGGYFSIGALPMPSGSTERHRTGFHW